MCSESIGMAIPITAENREKIAVVNGGVVPDVTDTPAYFYFPYDHDSFCQILAADVFFDDFEFANLEDPVTFVDVNAI